MLREMLDMVSIDADRLNRSSSTPRRPAGRETPAGSRRSTCSRRRRAVRAGRAAGRWRESEYRCPAGRRGPAGRGRNARCRPRFATRRWRLLEIPYGRFERRIDHAAGRWLTEAWALSRGCLLLTLRRLA
jgi:hypothetical protein